MYAKVESLGLNGLDAFSVTALYNSIMKDCTESLMGAIPV